MCQCCYGFHTMIIMSHLWRLSVCAEPVCVCVLSKSVSEEPPHTDCSSASSEDKYTARSDDSAAHLFIHEYVNERVDDGGELGQQRRHDGGLWAQEVSGAEGREQSRHSVGQPADQVAHHHRDDHHQHALLSAAGHHRTHAADLAEEQNALPPHDNHCSTPQTKNCLRTTDLWLMSLRKKGRRARLDFSSSANVQHATTAWVVKMSR